MNSILSIYQTNKTAFEGKTLAQILAFTGDGKLVDNNKTSNDFREFLSEIPSQLIKQFADNCLSEKFDGNGFALQDITNQIGARLSFKVTNGRYHGTRSDVGFDGIWKSKEDHGIIVEVKTSDAYRINLDTIAQYRTRLIEQKTVDKDKSSILIVVGRQDTGDLEAQIRGSRHAWDVRLLSMDSLLKLLSLRETLNDTKTIQQITELLKPREFTKIDQLIELIFVTSKDLLAESLEEVEVEEETGEKKAKKHSDDRPSPMNFNESCIEKIQEKLGINLVKQTRGSYANQNKSTALVCMVSKPHKQGKHPHFWFSFYPHQRDFLNEFQHSFVAFGCGTSNDILLLPIKEFELFLPNCGTTENDERMYWHILIDFRDDKYLIRQSKQGRGETTDITKYKI